MNNVEAAILRRQRDAIRKLPKLYDRGDCDEAIRFLYVMRKAFMLTRTVVDSLADNDTDTALTGVISFEKYVEKVVREENERKSLR